MGTYSEYLNMGFTSVGDLEKERKRQLQRIADIRQRDVLVIAADLEKRHQAVPILPADLLPISDQLQNLNGTSLDLILETPGGSGEAAEDIIRLIRRKYDRLGVIVPGTAKSAGTIMAMAADEILLDDISALGPIDAQMSWQQGKVFSADALLQGMEKIKKEVVDTGSLNRAYVPMLQGISPGELQHAQNALDFAKNLVQDWLATYKFKNWHTHSSTGLPVTDEDRRERAADIAAQLCDHGRWKTHARSITIAELKAMKLDVYDVACQPDLKDAIRRYYILLRMTFESNIFKIFETPVSQVMKFDKIDPGASVAGLGGMPPGKATNLEVTVTCKACNRQLRVQGNLGGGADRLNEGALPFPENNKLRCPCGEELDLTLLRKQVEAQTKSKITSPAKG